MIYTRYRRRSFTRYLRANSITRIRHLRGSCNTCVDKARERIIPAAFNCHGDFESGLPCPRVLGRSSNLSRSLDFCGRARSESSESSARVFTLVCSLRFRFRLRSRTLLFGFDDLARSYRLSSVTIMSLGIIAKCISAQHVDVKSSPDEVDALSWFYRCQSARRSGCSRNLEIVIPSKCYVSSIIFFSQILGKVSSDFLSSGLN